MLDTNTRNRLDIGGETAMLRNMLGRWGVRTTIKLVHALLHETTGDLDDVAQDIRILEQKRSLRRCVEELIRIEGDY